MSNALSSPKSDGLSPDPSHPDHCGYEPADAHIGAIVKFLVWLFIGTAIILVAMYALVVAYKKMPLPNNDVVLHPLAVERQVPSEPHLEALRGIIKDNDGHLISEKEQPYFNRKMAKQWNQQWKDELHSYGWVDEQIKLAHIPIERAMELKLKKGFPTAKTRN